MKTAIWSCVILVFFMSSSECLADKPKKSTKNGDKIHHHNERYTKYSIKPSRLNLHFETKYNKLSTKTKYNNQFTVRFSRYGDKGPFCNKIKSVRVLLDKNIENARQPRRFKLCQFDKDVKVRFRRESTDIANKCYKNLGKTINTLFRAKAEIKGKKALKTYGWRYNINIPVRLACDCVSASIRTRYYGNRYDNPRYQVGRLPEKKVGDRINEKFFYAGDVRIPAVFTLVGNIPNGLSFSSKNGVLSGVVRKNGVYEFSIVSKVPCAKSTGGYLTNSRKYVLTVRG